MKSLYILRHGKSDWSDAVVDHERPLSTRGERAAGVVGRFLALAGQEPDLIISSTALSARSTATLAASAGDWCAKIQETRALYGATVDDALHVIATAPESVERLMIVAHEPMCSSLVQALADSDVAFVTAALAHIELPIASWSVLGPDRRDTRLPARLIFFVPPKLFTRGDFSFAKRKR